MEGHSPYRLLVLATLAWTLILSHDAVQARDFNEVDPDPPPVSSDGSQVTVELILRSPGGGLTPRVGGGPRSSDGEPVCVYRLVEIPTAAEAFAVLGEPPAPDAVPYWLMCGSARVQPMWITPGDIVDIDQVVRGEADRYVQTVLGPGLQLRTEPSTYAVTGIPARLWVDGWDGTPIAVPPINPFGDSIDITLRLASVTWDPGDGTTPLADDLELAHTYTHRSTSADAPDGAYQLQATITIEVSYRLNGGAENAVTPPLTTTATASLVVRQAQAVLG